MKPFHLPRTRLTPVLVAVAAVCAAAAQPAIASSHREAPSITTMPKVDATDFYMFNSYEPGRAGFVTLIANYQPLQDPYGGPNYFKLDPNALYEIHVDNVGDGKEAHHLPVPLPEQAEGHRPDHRHRRQRQIRRDPADPVGPGDGTECRGPERQRDLHPRRRPRRPPHRHARRPSPTPPAAAPPSTSLRQHRHEDDPELRQLRRPARLQRQHPGLQRRPARSSSASARTRSPSTSA